MKIGIFETVFTRNSLDATLAAVRDAGFQAVQFDLQSAGIDPWRDDIPDERVKAIRQAADEAGVEIPAVSGTFNMAHPSAAVTDEGLRGFERVVRAAPGLGASFVTLCTGTRSEESMWKWHASNDSPEAWEAMTATVRAALEIAHAHGVTLVVEPEAANVASSAVKARALLDELADERLKIVLDPANIVLSDLSRPPIDVLRESVELLGPDIVFAHAKDVSAEGEFCAAGTGVVPWEFYWEALEQIGYSGAVVFHTLTEADVPRALATLPR
jgi:sugar phosphate isomerase/epimerase